MEFKIKKKLGFSCPPDNEPQLVYDARFHPNNSKSLIGVATIAGNIYIVEDMKVISKIKKHHKGTAIRKLRFDNDGHMVTIAKTVKIHDLNSNQTTHTLKREESNPPILYSVKPLSNHIICAGDDDGSVFVWDTRAQELPVFTSHDCEQYISDIDGRYDARRLMVCTSGEGTLTAYDLRANKMIEPQSELFEAGFQCVKMVESNKKVVIGGEDGAIYVFNQNEWAHTSGKFAVSEDTGNRGKCSIDALDMIPDSSIFVAACSDGRVRSLTLWPHEIVSEKSSCKSSLESIHVNPNQGKSEMVVSGDNNIFIIDYEEKSDDEAGEQSDDSDESTGSSHTTESSDEDDATDSAKHESSEPDAKKMKTNTDDYLNVFT